MRSLPKFIVTIELGRLARWLRVLGYDCVFFDRTKSRDLVIESLRQDRVILTRDSRLSRFSGANMVHIDSDYIDEQILQVIKRLRLKIDRDRMFTRCAECNTPIGKIDKKGVKKKVPPFVYKTHDDFMYCAACKKIYWKGTHWGLANKFLDAAGVKR